MKTLPPIRLGLASILLAGVLLLVWMAWVGQRLSHQSQERAELRHRLSALPEAEPEDQVPPPPPSATSSRPSPELLRARASVADLRAQLAQARSRSSPEGHRDSTTDDDVDRLMNDRLPSSHPDFVAAADLRNVGFATPEQALESFWWHYAGPGRTDAQSFAGLWWNPEQEAPAGYHYVIHLGLGVRSFSGYRVVKRESISPDEFVFQLHREESQQVVEEEARFIRVGDHWARQPAIRVVKDGE